MLCRQNVFKPLPSMGYPTTAKPVGTHAAGIWVLPSFPSLWTTAKPVGTDAAGLWVLPSSAQPLGTVVLGSAATVP